MSKTPKTCALLERLLDRDGVVEEENAPFIWVRLCKEIERENADLLESLEIILQTTSRELFATDALEKARQALAKAKGGNQ